MQRPAPGRTGQETSGPSLPSTSAAGAAGRSKGCRPRAGHFRQPVRTAGQAPMRWKAQVRKSRSRSAALWRLPRQQVLATLGSSTEVTPGQAPRTRPGGGRRTAAAANGSSVIVEPAASPEPPGPTLTATACLGSGRPRCSCCQPGTAVHRGIDSLPWRLCIRQSCPEPLLSSLAWKGGPHHCRDAWHMPSRPARDGRQPAQSALADTSGW